MTTGFIISKHWFASSVWNFCRWVADVPPRETSPAAKSTEKRMFLQAAVKRAKYWLDRIPACALAQRSGGFRSVHRTCLKHQHGRRFIVWGHQYGRRDVMWKISVRLVTISYQEYSKMFSGKLVRKWLELLRFCWPFGTGLNLVNFRVLKKADMTDIR